jgi:hypothetical protein
MATTTDQEKKLVAAQIRLIDGYLKEGGPAKGVMNVMCFAMDYFLSHYSGWEGQTLTCEHCTFTITPVDAEKVDGEE